MITLRQALVEDGSRIRDFLADFFGERFPLKYPERWAWQFVRNPFRPPGGLPILLAFDGERIVGQLGFQYSPLWLNGQNTACAWGVDFGILPAYRGQGLGERLQALADESVEYLLSAVMDISAGRIKERLRFVKGRPVRCWRRFSRLSGNDVLRYLEAKASSRGSMHRTSVEWFGKRLHGAHGAAALLRAGSRWSGRLRRVAEEDEDTIRIEEFESFGPEIDALWKESRGGYPMTTARTSQFLNWRYVECPGHAYRKFRAVAGGLIVGFVVLRERNHPEFKSIRVLDLFCRREDTVTMRALLRFVIRHGAETSPFIEVASSEPAFESAFLSLGFIPMESKIPLAGGVFARSECNQRAAAHWFVTMGDHDWDQLRPVGAVPEQRASSLKAQRL